MLIVDCSIFPGCPSSQHGEIQHSLRRSCPSDSQRVITLLWRAGWTDSVIPAVCATGVPKVGLPPPSPGSAYPAMQRRQFRIYLMAIYHIQILGRGPTVLTQSLFLSTSPRSLQSQYTNSTLYFKGKNMLLFCYYKSKNAHCKKSKQ